MVMDLASRNDRDVLVEQRGERAQQPGLGLAAQAEQDEVVLRQQGVDHLRDDRVVVPDDAGKQGLTGPEPDQQVGAQFILDRPGDVITPGDRLAQFTQRRGSCV
jgi:hypothetical protein